LDILGHVREAAGQVAVDCGGPAMTVTADTLRAWAERICTLPSTDSRELVAALGIAGTVVPRFNALVIEPPLEGALEVKAVERRGDFDRLSLQLAGANIKRSELEERFGHGVLVPRVHPDSYFTVSYRLELPDAPFACEASAEFATEPTDDTPVAGVYLRRHQVQPAAPAPQVTLPELVEVLSKTSDKLRQEDGAEIRRHVEEVRDQVAHLGETMRAAAAAADDDVGRKAAAAEVAKLVDVVGKTGAAAGRALAKQGELIGQAIRQALGTIDTSALTDALRRFGALVASGTPESKAKIQELMAELEAKVGASLGKLFTAETERQQREDEERRAAIKKDVQASLDEIFRGKKKP
jgi:hypothetical protein